MSFDFPASVQEDIQQYARAEHISADAAALKLVQAGLKTVRRKTSKQQKQAIDWNKFEQLVPGFDLFQGMPKGTVEDIARTSRRLRSEKLTPRA